MQLLNEQHRRDLRPDWRKGFLIIAYFLLVGVVNIVMSAEWPFYILVWPLYVFPESPFLAAVFEMLFAYAVASVVDTLLRGQGR